jgi:hypothetical protein
MIQKIKNMQDVVKASLEKYPRYRDDDNKLVAYIWFKNLKNNGIPENIPAIEFLHFYANNELPQADVITRARRKVQEDHPHLRGKLWEERHETQKKVRKDINKN